MNKLVFGLLASLGGGAAGLGLVAARREPTVAPNTFVSNVAVGDLTVPEASRRLRVWWETEKLRKLRLTLVPAGTPIVQLTPGQLGISLDDAATVRQLPLQDFAAQIENRIAGSAETPKAFQPLFKTSRAEVAALADKVRAAAPPSQPAEVKFRDGSILLQHEVPSTELDPDALTSSLVASLKDSSNDEVVIPTKTSARRIPDEELEKISEVVATYTTHFPASQFNRCQNIKLASSKIDGVIVMPGERVSFNGTVGRRTIKAGFKLAGVYKQGKHDTGIGGGICQVSTTLYNAALFANLKIRQRSNHSMPVAYVPLGRDATVDYGSLDLVLENTYSNPIAICSQYRPGQLTFWVLGQKPPGMEIKVVSDTGTSWDRGVKQVIDPTLRPGTTKIVEKGSRGHSINTFRMVYQNGVMIRKEPLGRSYYGGGERLVAINPGGQKPMPAPASSSMMPTTGAGG